MARVKTIVNYKLHMLLQNKNTITFFLELDIHGDCCFSVGIWKLHVYLNHRPNKLQFILYTPSYDNIGIYQSHFLAQSSKFCLKRKIRSNLLAHIRMHATIILLQKNMRYQGRINQPSSIPCTTFLWAWTKIAFITHHVKDDPCCLERPCDVRFLRSYLWPMDFQNITIFFCWTVNGRTWIWSHFKKRLIRFIRETKFKTIIAPGAIYFVKARTQRTQKTPST